MSGTYGAGGGIRTRDDFDGNEAFYQTELHLHCLADRVGFEPTGHLTASAGFQDRSHRPLDHLSMNIYKAPTDSSGSRLPSSHGAWVLNAPRCDTCLDSNFDWRQRTL